MKKSELKQGIKSIINSIEIIKSNIDDYFKPHDKVKDFLNQIQEIEEESNLELDIDYDTILGDSLRNYICADENYENMIEEFDIFLADLENWYDESSESKSAEIQENYIDAIGEIKGYIDFDAIECKEDFENQLDDMITSLNNIEI